MMISLKGVKKNWSVIAMVYNVADLTVICGKHVTRLFMG